jgi:HlyD family secretion protein
MKKVIIGLLIVVVVAVVVVFAFGTGDGSKNSGPKPTMVEKGEIVEKALAIGTIEPYKEVVVKSKISGIVQKLYVEVGDSVKKGDLLMEIAPQATPLEYTEAKRNVDIAKIDYDNATTSFDRAKELRDKNLISEQDYDDKKMAFDQSGMQLNLAKERLQLLEKGSIKDGNITVESTIRSPITGSILSRNVNEGDPVVPLTSYQEGTALITLADMNDLVFRGTVDEIDVGKLREGMPVKLKIGALPKDTIQGSLYKISPKARKENSATVFDVEVRFNEADIGKLRAGYSATAEITIKEARDILVIPERFVNFRNDSTFVMVQDSLGMKKEHYVETGLSDGITIQVKSGLKEGEVLAERTAEESK